MCCNFSILRCTILCYVFSRHRDSYNLKLILLAQTFGLHSIWSDLLSNSFRIDWLLNFFWGDLLSNSFEGTFCRTPFKVTYCRCYFGYSEDQICFGFYFCQTTFAVELKPCQISFGFFEVEQISFEQLSAFIRVELLYQSSYIRVELLLAFLWSN